LPTESKHQREARSHLGPLSQALPTTRAWPVVGATGENRIPLHFRVSETRHPVAMGIKSYVVFLVGKNQKPLQNRTLKW